MTRIWARCRPARSWQREKTVAYVTGQVGDGQAGAEVNDPLSESLVGRIEVVPIQGQKTDGGGKRRTLVAVEKVLPFGDAVSENGGQRRYIGVRCNRCALAAFQWCLRGHPCCGADQE